MPSGGRIAALAALAAGLAVLAAWIPGAQAGTPRSRPFGGAPSTGVLFSEARGPGSHFCTASVISSPAGNLLLTSAHCMAGHSAGTVGFAPGYDDGTTPYGTDVVTGVFTDRAWAMHRSADDDVAILEVGTDIQQQTGALTLVTGDGPRRSTVLGYPDGKDDPVTCTARATWFRKGHQMRFVCGGYPNGTSGGPWVTGRRQVYGVIGGYQQGGNVSWISYSPYFGGRVRALYKTAVAQDP